MRVWRGLVLDCRRLVTLRRALRVVAAAALVALLGGVTGVLHTTSDEAYAGPHVGTGGRHNTQQELNLRHSTPNDARLRGPLEYDDPYVLEVLREQYLHPPSTEEYSLEESEEYLDYKMLVSWVFLRSRVVALLGESKGGFFVEAGALDGQFLSNTLPFELDLGWSGLLVEANPASYRALRSRHRKAWTSPVCLSPSNYPQELILNLMEATGRQDLPWIARGSSHLQSTSGNDQADMRTQFHTTYASVQCFPLASLLLSLNTTHVDLLSLDVEGSEPAILQSLPWSAVTVSVLLVEHHGEKEGRDANFHDYIARKGYMLFDHYTDENGVTDYVFVENQYYAKNKLLIDKRVLNIPNI